MKEENVKIYDENGVYQNKMMRKKDAKEGNFFHKAIHLWIMVGDKVLIQQRSENKKIFPNKWDISVAGHIVENDSSLTTVVKELHEELGIEEKKENIEYLYCLRRTSENKGNIFFDTYLLRLPQSFNLSIIKLEELEVKDIKLVDISYLENVANNLDDTFAPRAMECKMFLEYIQK